MKRLFDRTLSILLAMALSLGLCGSFQTAGVVRAATDDHITNTGVSIPLNQQTNINVGRRSEIFEEFDAFSFTTGSQKAYYTFVWGGSTLTTKPEYMISTEPSKNSSNYVVSSPNVDDYCELGSVGGGGRKLTANTTYYLMLQHGQTAAYTATVSINCYEDPEADTSNGAAVITAGTAKTAAIQGKGDVDVFCFNTTTDKYTMELSQKRDMRYRIYSDAELTNCVYNDSYSRENVSVDMDRYLSDNTRYYIQVERNVNTASEPVEYSINFKKKSDSGQDESKDGVKEGTELKLLEPAKITVTKNDGGSRYVTYPFKTGSMKAFYSIFWSSSDYQKISFTLYKNSDGTGYVTTGSVNAGEGAELGGSVANPKKLQANTTYYICIDRDYSKDFSGTLTVNYVMDEEADTADLADPIIPDVVKYGSIDGNSDIDVFYLDTGNNTYNLSGEAEKQVVITIYKDKLLANKLYSTTFYNGDRKLALDLTKSLEKNETYYIVISPWADPKGGQIGYQLNFKKAEGTDTDKQDETTDSGNTDTTGTTGNTTSKTTKNGKYYKSIKKSKSYVTNMGSKVKVSFKSGKIIVKKGSGGFLCKKSKAKNYVFTKASELKKKKYTYKLAKGCKIIYGSSYYSVNRITETKKSKSWVKKYFKNGGGGNSIGLCLNSKNQVTMIYVSGFDVYAEQM